MAKSVDDRGRGARLARRDEGAYELLATAASWARRVFGTRVGPPDVLVAVVPFEDCELVERSSAWLADARHIVVLRVHDSASAFKEAELVHYVEEQWANLAKSFASRAVRVARSSVVRRTCTGHRQRRAGHDRRRTTVCAAAVSECPFEGRGARAACARSGPGRGCRFARHVSAATRRTGAHCAGTVCHTRSDAKTRNWTEARHCGRGPRIALARSRCGDAFDEFSAPYVLCLLSPTSAAGVQRWSECSSGTTERAR
jgi:hypothetical protein